MSPWIILRSICSTPLNRFEYSLKAAGFHNGDGPAEANWRRFAEQAAALFDDPQDEALNEAITYILNHPPKKQA